MPLRFEGHGTDRDSPVALARFDYDPPAGRLDYEIGVTAAGQRDLVSVWLHRVKDGRTGAALHLLLDARTSPPRGHVLLSASDHADLLAGRIRMRIYTTREPLGIEWTLEPRPDPLRP
jgi:hypothetical protein